MKRTSDTSPHIEAKPDSTGHQDIAHSPQFLYKTNIVWRRDQQQWILAFLKQTNKQTNLYNYGVPTGGTCHFPPFGNQALHRGFDLC